MATIILKAGRNLAQTYYKGTCPECGLIGAFKESEADKKSFYATGRNRRYVTATEFKVYFHYREEDTDIVKDWREKYDLTKRYRNRG